MQKGGEGRRVEGGGGGRRNKGTNKLFIDIPVTWKLSPIVCFLFF